MTSGPVVLDGHIHWGKWTADRDGWPHCDLPLIRRVLDRCGIDGAVLFPTDAADNEGLARALAPDPTGFHMFAWVDPHDPDGTGDFLAGHGSRIAGLKIHPSLTRLRVTDDAWRPFLAYASRWRLPVIVHCGRWEEMAGWRFVLEVAEQYPDASFVLGHMGGDLPAFQRDCAMEMAERDLPNAFLGTESIREHYSLRFALDRIGPEKIIFGSDYPLGWPAAYLAVLEGADPTEEERELVLGENLLRLIRRRRVD